MQLELCSSDKAAQKKLEKRRGTSKQVFFSRSFQDTTRLDIFQGMPSTCDDLSEHALPSHLATQHLPRPLMKLMTLALLQHTAALSIVGKEDMVSRVVLNQGLLVKSTDVHILCVRWHCPAGHSFHGAQSRTAGVF